MFIFAFIFLTIQKMDNQSKVKLLINCTIITCINNHCNNSYSNLTATKIFFCLTLIDLDSSEHNHHFIALRYNSLKSYLYNVKSDSSENYIFDLFGVVILSFVRSFGYVFTKLHLKILLDKTSCKNQFKSILQSYETFICHTTLS